MNEYRCPCGWGATATHPEGIIAASKYHREQGCEESDDMTSPTTVVGQQID